MTSVLTVGPILFHWPAEKKRDFYFQIADESPVDTVYLGEVICSKRSPFFDQYYPEVADRLVSGGKKVVFSSLAEIMIPRERKMTESLCESDDFEVEANDAAALYHLRGRPHRIGQYFNVYNEDTMGYLAANGANHFAVPSELPKDALEVLGAKARELNVGLEVQVYGRTGLALSARCYHARSHGRVKDNCQFVCGEDPDGMDLETLNHQPFLTVNGIQTLSHTCLNLIQELDEMQQMGISHFRLSPHSKDMIPVIAAFDRVLKGRQTAKEALNDMPDTLFGTFFSNGFYHKNRGYVWKAA